MNPVIFILILCLQVQVSAGSIIGNYCSPNSEAFYYIPEDVQLAAFDLATAVEDEGIWLGGGTFGKIYEVPCPSPNGPFLAAVKKVHFNSADSAEERKAFINDLDKELYIMLKMASAGQAPAVYGCMWTDEDFYIVQERLFHNLDYQSFKDYISVATPYKSLVLYKQILDGLQYLWSLGFMHRDIKPANIMIDDAFKKAYLIDFGSVLRPAEDLGTFVGGTPYFMSWDYFNSKQLKHESDLYALCMSIAVIESGTWDIFIKYSAGRKLGHDIPHTDLGNHCFMGMIEHCIDDILQNVAKVMKKADYGPYQPWANLDTMNFTTLVVAMLDYRRSKMTRKQFIRGFNRIFKEAKQKEIKREAEAVARLKRIEISRQNINARLTPFKSKAKLVPAESHKVLNNGLKKDLVMGKESKNQLQLPRLVKIKSELETIESRDLTESRMLDLSQHKDNLTNLPSIFNGNNNHKFLKEMPLTSHEFQSGVNDFNKDIEPFEPLPQIKGNDLESVRMKEHYSEELRERERKVLQDQSPTKWHKRKEERQATIQELIKEETLMSKASSHYNNPANQKISRYDAEISKLAKEIAQLDKQIIQLNKEQTFESANLSESLNDRGEDIEELPENFKKFLKLVDDQQKLSKAKPIVTPQVLRKMPNVEQNAKGLVSFQKSPSKKQFVPGGLSRFKLVPINLDKKVQINI